MSTNRIPVPIQNIAVGDIVKLRNGEERTITVISENPDNAFPIACDSCDWDKNGHYLISGEQTGVDIIEVWREIPTPIEVTAVIAGDGVPKPVEALARRLAATDGISPDGLTLIGETMKNGIVMILHSIELQPAWMRYIQQATQIIEQVLQDQGDGWFPIETLDPVATPSVSLWIQDGEKGYLIADAYYSTAGCWESGGYGIFETIPVSMLDGNVTHWRYQAKAPVDIAKPKT